MARKPIEHERVGMLTPRERIWQAVRKLRTGFTTKDMDELLRPIVKKDTLNSYMGGLVAAGYLETERPASELGVGEIHVYTLIKDSFEAPRVSKTGKPVSQGLATLAMWRAMHVLGVFDHRDIAKSASLGTTQVSPAVAKAYVLQLSKAGYFRIVKPSSPGVPARYQLVRYTGAEPPAVTSRKCVFDRNLGQFTWEAAEQEVCDDIA